jgi:predicted SnoaL-like aldol condensation-catalyzing enzyme
MSVEANKAVARIWFEEIVTNRNLDALDQAYAPTYIHRGPEGHEIGRNQARAVAEMLLARSEDREARVVEQIAEGDRVVTRWESRGTHTGPMAGHPPTGEEIVVRGIVISRVADGRIVEDWEMTHVVDDPSGGT